MFCYNKFIDIVNYFSTPERPVTCREFIEFWQSLTLAEEYYFTYTPLTPLRSSK